MEIKASDATSRGVSAILTLAAIGAVAISAFFFGRASVEERFPSCPEDGIFWRAEIPGPWHCSPLDDVVLIEQHTDQ